MADTYDGRQQWKRDTAANFTSADATLLSGEPAIEIDTGLMKIGDGSTAWTSLLYFDPTPIGTIKEWNLNDTPANYLFPYILLTDALQGVSVSTYANLVKYTYVGDGNNAAVAAAGGAYYKADNADGSSPNTAGAYLILPAANGVTVRGLDGSATYDPDGGSRYLGDLQADAFESHTHVVDSVTTDGSGTFYGSGNNAGSRYTPSPYNIQPTAPTGGDETRMYNRSTKFAIKY